MASKSLKQFFGHLKTVRTHRKYVRYYCFLVGLYRQGLLHDLSKYSPVEFIESVKYYTGLCSPIDICKKKNGYSMAWLHHRGRNKHHCEYWVDNFDVDPTTILIPYKYALELVCDYLGAGRAYRGKDFTYTGEYEWWVNKRKILRIHPRIADFISYIFYQMKEDEVAKENPEGILLYGDMKQIYNNAVEGKYNGIY